MNINLIEALESIPGHTKFMKVLVMDKRMVNFEPVDNVNHYSAIASRYFVEKKKELGVFTIPCTMGFSTL